MGNECLYRILNFVYQLEISENADATITTIEEYTKLNSENSAQQLEEIIAQGYLERSDGLKETPAEGEKAITYKTTQKGREYIKQIGLSTIFPPE